MRVRKAYPKDLNQTNLNTSIFPTPKKKKRKKKKR